MEVWGLPEEASEVIEGLCDDDDGDDAGEGVVLRAIVEIRDVVQDKSTEV